MAEPQPTLKVVGITQIQDRKWGFVTSTGQYIRSYRPNRPSDRSAIYIHVEDDNESVFENFVNRESRPYKVYRQAIPEILRLLGHPADTRVTWSQKAGCSCPCSPGFVIDPAVDSGRDIWVTLEAGTPTVIESDPRRAQRFQALVDDPTIPVSA